MTFMKRVSAATAIGAIMAATAAPVWAQVTDDSDLTASDLGVDTQLDDQVAEDGATASGDVTMMAEGEFSDEMLNAFVAAALEIRDVRENYAQQISEATDEAAAEALVLEAQAEMLAVVDTAEDITPEEYMAIGNAVQTDAELAERLTALFQAEMGVPDDGAADQG